MKSRMPEEVLYIVWGCKKISRSKRSKHKHFCTNVFHVSQYFRTADFFTTPQTFEFLYFFKVYKKIYAGTGTEIGEMT